MQQLKVADNGFLQMECPETPMHVGGLNIFKIPKGEDKDEFIQKILKNFEVVFSGTPPFNQRLVPPPNNLGLPSLDKDNNIEMAYHIRHSAIPSPGTNDQLVTLVARFHSTLLDRSRPLWEFHLIEGLENNRFALYFKVHHACLDGIGAMKLMKSILSTSPDVKELKPIAPKKSKKRPKLSLQEQLGNVVSQIQAQAQTLPQLSTTMADIGLQAINLKQSSVPLWYSAPASPLNAPVTGQRRLAVLSFPLDHFKKIGKSQGATINDVVLTICAGAVRRYFNERQELPNKSMVGCIPVSIAPKEGPSSGNAISSLMCSLGTHIEDPLERLKHVHVSTRDGKAQLSSMSREALETYTILMALPILVGNALNRVKKMQHPFNLLVSNVPASSEKLYLCGAEMEALFAVNLIFEMQALNITCTSYLDSLDFSLIACRTAIPDLDKLSGYLKESFEELGKAAGVTQTKKK